MSKSDHTILERRLRSTYELLDAGNPKRALAELQKILKKHPDIEAGKVLKGLCLIRMEKYEEGMEIVDSVDLPDVLHDENTLQAFQHCFREAGLPERIAQLYEKTVKLQPNEHNLAQLFVAYMRIKDYKKQQIVGVRLYKETGKHPYTYWAIMSIILQAAENPALAKNMLLPLAEKMFHVQIEKTGFTDDNAAEVELHVLILEALEKFNECLKVLDTEAAKKLQLAPIFLVEKRCEYLTRLEKFEDLKKISEEQLSEMPDNWTLWQYFIQSVLDIMKNSLVQSDEKFAKKVFDAAVEFINERSENIPAHVRGPSLAKLELLKKVTATVELKSFHDINILGDFTDILMEFIKKAYRKPVAYTDIQMYFGLLNEDRKADFFSKLHKWMSEVAEQDDKNGDEHKVFAIILYEKIRRALGEWEKESVKQKRQRFHQLVAQIFHPGRSEIAQGLLCQLAVASPWDSWRKDNDWVQFYELILVLEHVASKNKTDPVSKISLLRCYSHVGNTSRAIALTKLLDIKSVQHDTLGFLAFSVYELAGRFNLGIIHNTQIGDSYDQADKEIVECMSNAYRNSRYGQIPKLVRILEKVKKSAQATASDVLNRYLTSLFVIDDLDIIITTCYGDEEPIQWDTLMDNRDLTTIPTIENDSYPALLNDMKSRTFKEFIDIFRLRHYICRAIACVGRLTRENCNPELTRVEFKIELLTLKDHLKYCISEYQSFDVPSRLPQGPPPVGLAQWAHSGGVEIVIRLLEAAQKVVELLDEKKEVDAVETLGPKTKLAEELCKLVNVCTSDYKPAHIFAVNEPTIAASRAIQTLATVQITLRMIERLFDRKGLNSPPPVDKPNGTAKGKKAQKTKSNDFTTHIGELHHELRTAGLFLNTRFEILRQAAGDSFEEFKIGQDLGQMEEYLKELRVSVDSRISKAYVNAFEDMQTTIVSRF